MYGSKYRILGGGEKRNKFEIVGKLIGCFVRTLNGWWTVNNNIRSPNDTVENNDIATMANDGKLPWEVGHMCNVHSSWDVRYMYRG